MRTLLGIWNLAHGVVSLVHRTISQSVYARASILIRQLKEDEVRMCFWGGIWVWG